MEAFAEAIAKLEAIEMRKGLTIAYVGAQGTHKAFTDFLKSINLNKNAPDHAQAADDFFAAYKRGFKGDD
jgi:hypothetical protein